MRIAFLIQAHGNYQHLQRLVNALNFPDWSIFIHIDRKSPIPHISGQNLNFINKRVKIGWGGFSQVRATLKLLEIASTGNYDYYVLLSGTDYPIKPNLYLLKLLEKEGGEYIDIKKSGVDPFAPISRYKYYYFTDLYNRRDKSLFRTKFFLTLQIFLKKIKVQKKIPFTLYTGASWFILSHNCIKHILNKSYSETSFTQFYKNSFCPDESFFQTIIGNSSYLKDVKGYLTYADWSTSPGPAIIDKRHMRILESTDCFFARKFLDSSEEIVNEINVSLRKEN